MPAITKLNTRWSNLLETLDESGAVTKTITAGMWMLEGAIAGLDVIFGGWTTKLEHMIEVDASRWMAIYEQSLKDVGTQAGLTEEQIKALAEEQNKLAGNMISTTESMMSINDDYQKSLDEISKDETLTAQERITAIKKVEQEHEIATRKIILSMAQQILAQDGLTIDEANALLQQGVNWGIYSQTAVDEMMKVINEAGGLASAINSIPPSKEIKITTIYSSVGGGSSATVPVDIARLEREQNRDLNGNKIIGKASGGPVYANTPYIVGERGPELFVPGQSGGIVPNNKMGMNDSQLLDEIKSMNSMLSNLPYMMRDVMESIK
jgi:hypothetical protein